MLQHVAVCCSVLQRVTYVHTTKIIAGVGLSAIQCVAACCSLLQCVAACAVRYSVLPCVAACCSMLQHVAACCSVLQCVAVCCSVLQRVTYVHTTKIISGVGLSEALFFGVSNDVRELHPGLECVENVRQRARKDALHLDDLVARLQEVLLQRACVCACV